MLRDAMTAHGVLLKKEAGHKVPCQNFQQGGWEDVPSEKLVSFGIVLGPGKKGCGGEQRRGNGLFE